MSLGTTASMLVVAVLFLYGAWKFISARNRLTDIEKEELRKGGDVVGGD